MEEKNKKGIVKFDFDLNNKLDKAVFDLFQRMLFGYKKKFIVAAAKPYLNFTSEQIKEMIDELEYSSQFGLQIENNLQSDSKSKKEDSIFIQPEILKTETKRQEIVTKTNSSKLFKKS